MRIILVFLLMFVSRSCSNGEYYSLLILENEEFNKIINNICSNKHDEYIYASFYEQENNISIDISCMMGNHYKEDLPLILEELYGIYMFQQKQILIFGENAKVIFKKTNRKAKVEYLDLKNARTLEDDIPPIPFDPEIRTYYIKNDSIIFLRTNSYI